MQNYKTRGLILLMLAALLATVFVVLPPRKTAGQSPRIAPYIPAAPKLQTIAQPPPYCPPAQGPTKADEPAPAPALAELKHVQLHKLDLEEARSLFETSVLTVGEFNDPAELAPAFASAQSAPKKWFAAGTPLAVLSLGPQLDSPDQFSVQSVTRDGQTMTVQIAYTNVRARGANLRRNIPWRPMVMVPLTLPVKETGVFTLKVTWTAREQVPDGKALPEVTPRTDTLNFEIGVPDPITPPKPSAGTDAKAPVSGNAF